MTDLELLEAAEKIKAHCNVNCETCVFRNHKYRSCGLKEIPVLWNLAQNKEDKSNE